jgi:hypothetical protein
MLGPSLQRRSPGNPGCGDPLVVQGVGVGVGVALV